MKDKDIQGISEIMYRYAPNNNSSKKYLYQYRTLDGFWSILTSDSFWATNARFSNDTEEQKLGIELINRFFHSNDTEVEINSGDMGGLLEDCYIICFCGDDDKLSQWRGYAAEGGVSIGFDFSTIRPYYICTDMEELKLYNECIQVTYLARDIPEVTFKQVFDYSKNQLNSQESSEIVKAIIPIIKHYGFNEENEYRLVFSGKRLNRFVQYKNAKGEKIPYIVVKAGSKNKRKRVALRFPFQMDNKDEIIARIKKELYKKLHIQVEIIDCYKDKYTNRNCAGCIKKNIGSNLDAEFEQCKRNKGYTFTPEKAIYISDCQKQEEVFDIVYDILHNFHKWNKQDCPKVWCEGHLPIRKITVSPGKRKMEIKESIEHYCRHTYWLKDVDIEESIIPYRS